MGEDVNLILNIKGSPDINRASFQPVDKVPRGSEELKAEIQRDREAHGKKPLKSREEEKDENDESYDDEPKGGKINKNTSKKKLARMEMKSALTFACMNLKKLANARWNTYDLLPILLSFSHFRIKNPAYFSA